MSNEVSTNVQPSYELTVDQNGKYKRKAVYKPFTSVRPETKEQKIAMMNLLDSDDVALPMNDFVNETFDIADVIIKPYDSVDEDTGEITSGVLSYLITPDGKAYVTSSKSVYFTLQTLFSVFGEPHYNEDERITVMIVKKQGERHKYTDIKVIG